MERCYRSGPPQAVVYPDGSIDGVADPQVATLIREALAEDQAIVWTNQGLGWTTLQGPATRYGKHALEWLALVGAALRARGLHGYAFGWPLPAAVRCRRVHPRRRRQRRPPL